MKKFDAILKDIKNNGRNTIPIRVKSLDKGTNLNPLIIKLLNPGKMFLKKNCGLDEVFNIFNEIDNNHHELCKYNPRTSNMINRNNEKLD